MKREWLLFDSMWFNATIFLLLAICFGAIVYGIIEHYDSKEKFLEPKECSQKTLQYIGFDGKKHQAIVLHTDIHNWVLVEKK
jgi:hypothetical protein